MRPLSSLLQSKSDLLSKVAKPFWSIFSFLWLFNCHAYVVDINPIPHAIIYTPHSILKKKPGKEGIRYAGNRPRYSTCSGVCWFKDNRHLLAVNMQDSSFNIYRFESNRLVPLHYFNNRQGTDLARPESVDISANGEFIVVPSMSSGKIHFFQTSGNSILPRPIKTIQGRQVHGIRLSPDNRFIVAATFSDGIHVYKTQMLEHIQHFGDRFLPMRAKSLDFSLDGRFVVIGACRQLSSHVQSIEGIVAVYLFDSERGQIGDHPIAENRDIVSVETLQFHPNGRAFFAVDQVNDQVIGYEFDQESGAISDPWIALDGPTSKLSMPHGIGFSPDGKYVAVTSYGDDKITLYEVSLGE